MRMVVEWRRCGAAMDLCRKIRCQAQDLPAKEMMFLLQVSNSVASFFNVCFGGLVLINFLNCVW